MFRRLALCSVAAATLGCADASTSADAAADATILTDHPDASVDASVDVATDAARDAVADTSLDAARDVTVDAARDAVMDAADVAADAPRDTAIDVAADVAIDVARDSATDATVADARDVADAPPIDPLAALGACLGTAAPLTISHQMPYLSVAVGAQRGAFMVDYGSSFSSIDLAAFAPPGPSTSGCDRSRLGVWCTVSDFAFFAPPSPVTLMTEDFSGVVGDVRQAGILGTDFTSLRVTALSYAAARMYPGASPACTDAAWRAAGFAPLSTVGYFSNNLSTLAPMTSVDAAAAPGTHVPNIPTVPVRIGAARAVAQLDTGFDDALVTHSVNINTAFLAAIQAADPGALVRSAGRDLALSTCVPGVSEPIEAYTLSPGRALEFIDAAGAVARRAPDATVFVKRTPPAAHSCGGIGTWTAPAAQVAASFFVSMGAIAFDPFSARVWVPSP